MLTLTAGRGPGKRRRRAGTQTHAYIKNNNKNLLALQTAQPAPGDRLAWHFQTSWTCPNSSQTWAPSHAHRSSLQQCSTACTLEPPFAERNSQPPESYHLSNRNMLCFPVSQGGASLPPKAMHDQIKREFWGRRGPFFWLEKPQLHLARGGLGEAGNYMVSHARQTADPGGSWD